MSFKKFLEEGKDKYFDLSGARYDMEDMEKMMGDHLDMIEWEGDVAVVPSKIQKHFEEVCKKLGIKLKEVKK